MKNSILMMCIVACASVFSSCSTDDSYQDDATNKYQTQSGTSALRPINPVDPTVAGNITGRITPSIPAEAMAINSKGIHYYGVVYDTGDFQIQALTPGTYTVTIVPKTAPYQPVSVLNVVVRPSANTDVGALSFYVEE